MPDVEDIESAESDNCLLGLSVAHLGIPFQSLLWIGNFESFHRDNISPPAISGKLVLCGGQSIRCYHRGYKNGQGH